MSLAKQLRVITQDIVAPAGFDITRHLPSSPTVFLRNGSGIVGFGEAVRFESHGENRIEELASMWREQIAQSEIQDSLQMPGTGLVAFGSMAFAAQSNHRSVLVVPRIILGTRDGKTWITKITPAREQEAVGNFYREIQQYPKNTKLNFSEGALSSEDFKQTAQRAIEKIHAGEIQKVVLARDIVATLSDQFDLRDVLKTLAHRFPSCWVYSVAGNFGASPELLVRVSHGQVSARVLAGTTARGTTIESDQLQASKLAASNKNLAEHKFAVESMVTALTPFCVTVDADETPFSLALPNLWHLASDVYGKLKGNYSVLDLAAVLHPTAAVAGTPRADAQKLISELEPFDRGGYAGPVGWIGGDGDGEWAIALRGGYIQGEKLTAFAGCGLVSESEPIAELAETELKFAPIRNALS
ncbi:MAG: isochorismate synthase MenF [Actinomycetota bacterium]